MKKLISVFAIGFLAFTLFECVKNPAEDKTMEDNPSRFVQIEDGDSWYIVYDNIPK